jgi:hypothetical protein
MRKRSEAVQQSSEFRQTELPLVKKEFSLPDYAWVESNILFVHCSDCGLNQSMGTAKRDGGGVIRCFRCKGSIDKTNTLTPALIVDAESHKTVGKPHFSAPEILQNGKTQGAQGNNVVSLVQHETCKQCDARLTETAIGFFCPNGHDQKVKKAESPKVAMNRDPQEVQDELNGESPIKPRVTTNKTYKTMFGEAPVEPKVTTNKPIPEEAYKTMFGDALGGVAEVPDSITVQLGEETFSPRKYNTFRTGTLTMTTKVRLGETSYTAAERALAELEKVQELVFQRKLKSFTKHLAEIDSSR